MYKIEVTIMNCGKKTYRAFYRKGGPWFYSWDAVLSAKGDGGVLAKYVYSVFLSREEALEAIDLHHGKQVSSIEVEYIKK